MFRLFKKKGPAPSQDYGITLIDKMLMIRVGPIKTQLNIMELNGGQLGRKKHKGQEYGYNVFQFSVDMVVVMLFNYSLEQPLLHSMRIPLNQDKKKVRGGNPTQNGKLSLKTNSQ